MKPEVQTKLWRYVLCACIWGMAVAPVNAQQPDVNPRFPGCEEKAEGEALEKCAQRKLMEFVYTRLRYPEAAREAGVEGAVVVRFIVAADGRIEAPEIVRSIGGGCDEEVLRVVGEMPRWAPARKDGKPVAMSFNLPVRFKIDHDEAPVEEVFKVVEEMPRFPGCEAVAGAEDKKQCALEALFGFVGETVRYPASAKAAGVEGTVVLKFVVDKTGRPVDPVIAKSAGRAFDEEVLRLFHLMPDWIPGRQRGRVVNVQMALPIKFKLPEDPDAEAEQETLALQDFRLSPNPTGGQVALSFQAEAQPLLVTIVDLNGRRYYREYIQDFDGAFQADIDLGDAPSGPLLLQIRQGKRIFSQQVVRK